MSLAAFSFIFMNKTRQLTIKSTLLWQLLVVGIISLPYLVAWISTPDGMVFTGALLNPDDMGVYVSAMRQGAAGRWLYQFTYSPEPWQPRLMLLLYLVLGKLSFTPPTVLTLHIWRTILTIFSLWGLIFWVRTLFPANGRLQLSGWLLILFGSGAGWLAVLFTSEAASWSPDLGSAEWSPLLALFNTPHFALGLGLETAVFGSLVQMTKPEQPHPTRWAFVAAIAALLDSLVYVYHLAIIGLVVGIFMIVLAIQARRIPWKMWLNGAIVLLPLLPLLAYYGLDNGNDPYWTQYISVDHIIPPPPPSGVLVGLGGVGILALLGVVHWLKHSKTMLIPIWAIVNLGLLYMPGISYSGRFGLGLMIPVATLAAFGMEKVILPATPKQSSGKITPTPRATLRRVFFILLLPSVLMSILLFVQGPRLQPDFPYYFPQADVDAARWLGEHTDETAVVFAYYPLGNYLPQTISGKVFMGQLDFTTNLDDKLDLYAQFWQMNAQAQTQFLEEWGITHIFLGTYEAEFKTSIPAASAIIYEADGVAILIVDVKEQR